MRSLFRRIGLTTKKRWIITLAIAMPILGIASAELTSQSWFCNSCHIMGPYYQSWKTGKHKDVECVKCHISPGVTNFVAAKLNGLGQVVDDVLARTSPKPSASVSEFSCMRSGCHSLEKVRETEKTSGNFKFVHEKHLDLEFSGIKLGCGSCHSHTKGTEHFELNTNVCITCHMLQKIDAPPSPDASGGPSVIRVGLRDGKAKLAADAPAATHEAADGSKTPPANCSACHNPPDKPLDVHGLKVDHSQYLAYGAACESCHRGATAVPEPMEDGRCLSCHTFGVERATDVVELHKVHNGGHHKIECFSCHGTVRHGPAAQTASIEQFDCRRCHINQHAVQRQTYLADGSAKPDLSGSQEISPMFLAHVDCTGCHIQQRALHAKPDSGASVFAGAAKACDRCHKPGLGEQMVPLWQKTTHTLYDELDAAVKAAEGEGVDAGVIEQTRRLMETVRIDGSWGVHNPKYTQQLLEQARERLSAARAKPGETPK